MMQKGTFFQGPISGALFFQVVALKRKGPRDMRQKKKIV